jgi:hypothetical protein
MRALETLRGGADFRSVPARRYALAVLHGHAPVHLLAGVGEETELALLRIQVYANRLHGCLFCAALTALLLVELYAPTSGEPASSSHMH